MGILLAVFVDLEQNHADRVEESKTSIKLKEANENLQFLYDVYKARYAGPDERVYCILHYDGPITSDVSAFEAWVRTEWEKRELRYTVGPYPFHHRTDFLFDLEPKDVIWFLDQTQYLQEIYSLGYNDCLDGCVAPIHIDNLHIDDTRIDSERNKAYSTFIWPESITL